MAKKTKAEANITRELLLDASETVFANKGVGASTLNDIAKEAGLTRGALYHHFKDKRDLIEGIMERALLPHTLPEIKDASEFRSVLEYAEMRTIAFLKELNTNERLKMVNKIIHTRCEMTPGNSEVMNYYRSFLNNIFDDLNVIFETAKEKGEIEKNTCPKTAALLIFSSIHGLVDLWLYDIGNIDLETEGSTLIKMLFKSLN